MADTADIARMIAERYGSDPEARRNPLLELGNRSTAGPTMDALPDRRPSLRSYQRPGDPLLGQNANEAVAARFGDSLAQRNWGEAILNAAELAAGGLPFGARGGRRGAKGSPGEIGRPAGPGAPPGGLPERGGAPGGAGGLAAPGGAEHPYTPVPGQPRIVKIPGYGEVEARPIPQVEEAARDYAQKRGREFMTPSEMPPLDPERARRIAQAYEAMQHDPANPDVKRAYEAMMEETLGQYQALRTKGMEFSFNEPGKDPYAKSPALGYVDMRDNGHLAVFPTLEGFGSGVKLTKEQIANNPLLSDSGEKFGERPALMNDIFRAVHDAYGHNGPGNPFFRAPGEERAWQHHSTMYDPEARKAMTSETRGQNSWLNFGPYGEKNKNASAADTVYADQKVGLLPDWVVGEGVPPTKPRD